MKYFIHLITVGSLMIAINISAHVAPVDDVVQIVDISNNSREVCSPTICSPTPGNDRR